MKLLGIDIGGSGIKSAPVNVSSGKLTQDRVRVSTPSPSSTKLVAKEVAKLIENFNTKGPIGCTFPGIMIKGISLSAANVHKSWVDADANKLLSKACGRKVYVINDADAAGMAEIKFGPSSTRKGVTILLTLGTGIGSAIFVDGKLVPNTELGHLELDGFVAEHRAASRLKDEEDLSWEDYSKRLNRYLEHVEFLFSPSQIIIGGGISNKPERFMHFLKTRAKIRPARMGNNAGIVGAALWAAEHA